METMGGISSSSYALLLVASAAAAFFHLVFKHSGRSKKGRRLPGPAALPIIGHLHLLGPKAHQRFDKLCNQYGPIVGLRFGSTPVVIVGTVAAASEFYKTHDLIFAERPQTYASRQFAYEDTGFAFAPYGAFLKFVKKLAMTELLCARTMEQLLPTRREELVGFLKRLMEAARQHQPVDLSRELLRLTNNTISRMTIGRIFAPAAEEGKEPEEAMKLVKLVAELIGSINLSDYIWLLRGWDLQGINRRVEDVLRRYDAMMESIIKHKAEAAPATPRQGAAGRDLLELLLNASEDPAAEVKLTRENVKAIIMDILVAGSDSSEATLEWALTELINHPEMLQKAREEVDRVVGQERLVEERDVAEMPYIQTVIKETLRLHPAAVFVNRLCREDVTISGYHITAGTNVFINTWSLGRDPDVWADPLEFRPERFASGAGDGQKHLRLLPFGGGRRTCPGSGLAMLVVHTALAALLQSFDWQHVGKQDVEEGIGLVVTNANPLVCVPVSRFDSLPVDSKKAGILP